VTIYHVADVDAAGHMTVYCTTHTESAAERMLAAYRAAGNADVEIVPVGREATFGEQYGSEVAA
jgi:hypothetical protein